MPDVKNGFQLSTDLDTIEGEIYRIRSFSSESPPYLNFSAHQFQKIDAKGQVTRNSVVSYWRLELLFIVRYHHISFTHIVFPERYGHLLHNDIYQDSCLLVVVSMNDHHLQEQR